MARPTKYTEKYIAFKDKAFSLKYKYIQNYRVKNIEKILGTEIEKDTLYTIVTSKKMTRHTFTEYVIKNIGTIDELIITTYRMGLKTTRLINKAVEDGNIKKVFVLLSQNYKMLLGQSAEKVEGIFDQNDNMEFATAYNHSKITCIKSGDQYIVITGSGNYSENDQIEEYQIVRSKELFEHHKEWIDEARKTT